MIVKKEFKFDMAHRLSNYHGQCSNIHGHTYKLIVWLKGDIQKNGMVMDFSEVKKEVENTVIQFVDHSLAIYRNDPVLKQIEELLSLQCIPMKLCYFWKETTAENMIITFWEWLKTSKIKNLLYKLELYETETSSAVYRGEN